MIAILLMGGQGSRLGGKTPKQFLLLDRIPLFQYALGTFLSLKNLFQKILLVVPEKFFHEIKIEDEKVQLVIGGKSRQESVFHALQACPPNTDYVVIHDIARPFVTEKIIRANLQAVKIHMAVDTYDFVTDTIIQSRKGKFIHTIPIRKEMYIGQTPQSFSYSLLFRAHLKAQKENIYEATDDCQLILSLGVPIFMVKGSKQNFKITNAEDLAYARFLLQTIGITKPSKSLYSV